MYDFAYQKPGSLADAVALLPTAAAKDTASPTEPARAAHRAGFMNKASFVHLCNEDVVLRGLSRTLRDGWSLRQWPKFREDRPG